MQLNDNIKFTIDNQMSIGDEDCKNILIKGDNKAILPELVSVYGGKIKCIYIDPPYNNGDSYHYYNDNTTTSAWLKDMRSVLSWLKMLLKKDGSIWISIDDKEMAYLKVEADRIFGRENFASTIVWQQRKTRENRAVFSVRNNLEHNPVVQQTAELRGRERDFTQRVQLLCQLPVAVDMKCPRIVILLHRLRNHPHDPDDAEYMVGVRMADNQMVNACQRDILLPQNAENSVSAAGVDHQIIVVRPQGKAGVIAVDGLRIAGSKDIKLLHVVTPLFVV